MNVSITLPLTNSWFDVPTTQMSIFAWEGGVGSEIFIFYFGGGNYLKYFEVKIKIAI